MHKTAIFSAMDYRHHPEVYKHKMEIFVVPEYFHFVPILYLGEAVKSQKGNTDIALLFL
jgi:hypothetical protein